MPRFYGRLDRRDCDHGPKRGVEGGFLDADAIGRAGWTTQPAAILQRAVPEKTRAKGKRGGEGGKKKKDVGTA